MNPSFLLLLLPLWAIAQNEKGVSPLNPSRDLGTIGNPQSTWAVVIGISDYQEKEIPDLRFADRDAEAFANFLRSPAGGSLDNDHLQVLTNQNATAGQVAAALDWLLEQSKEGDEAIIYFSGHGDVERKIFTQPGFLLCWDAPSRVYMGGGTYSLAFLEAIVTTLSVQNKSKVVVITDACHAGKLAGSQIGGAKLTSANLAKQYANEVKILSCQPDEFSLEGEQWGGGRGVFSYHLVDGLFGLADKNGDAAVSLFEIGRYLEDKVTAEAAPQSQIPMLLGNKTERLATVNVGILADLKKAKSGGLPIFTATEGRGLEDEVLAKLDSGIVKKYFAFKKAVAEKRFFEPENDCAEVFYASLSTEPGLAPLQGFLKRNYAAALQDDAQQVLNTMLKSGLTSEVLSAAEAAVIYRDYPAYLDRAAELLGNGHYMYASLQARKFFFKGKIQPSITESKKNYFQALQWQTDLPHAYVELISICSSEQVDSAEFFAMKAMAIAPAWVVPYVQLARFYERTIKQPIKAEALLQQASELDSSSVLVWYHKALFYSSQNDFETSEHWYKKVVERPSEDICFPCAHYNLAMGYARARRYVEAEQQFKKAIQVDSTFGRAYINLGKFYYDTERFEEAGEQFKKAIQLDSTDIFGYFNLGNIYIATNRNADAEKYLKKALQLDSTNVVAISNLAVLYLNSKRYSEAEHYYIKSVQLDSTYARDFADLGFVLEKTQRFPEAELRYKKAIQLDSTDGLFFTGLGSVCFKTNRPEEARQNFLKAIELSPDYDIAMLGMACLLYSEKKTGEALKYVEQAIGKGSNFEQLESDEDLAPLRALPEWKELMKKHFPDQVKD